MATTDAVQVEVEPGAGTVVSADAGAERRQALGAFLRSRRERIAPADVGLPAGGRRRTPGLRREEVATLAGVGVTWYTWLEQGRDIHVSDDVLEAIGRTLQFDPNERRHLFALAGSREVLTDTNCPVITPAIQRMLAQLAPLPAYVINGRFDLLAYNRPYATLVDDLDALPYEDRNLLVLNLMYPAWRQAIVDWDDAVARCVAQLRASMAEHVAEPAWRALVARLQRESPEFAALWERQEVRSVENRVKSMVNERVGLLRFDFTSLWFSPGSLVRLVTYAPADERSADRLAQLAAAT